MHGKHGRRALSTEVYASKAPCRFANPRLLQEICARANARAQVEGQVTGPWPPAAGVAVVTPGAPVAPGAAVAGGSAGSGGASSPPAAGRSGRRRSRYVAPAEERSASTVAAATHFAA